MVDFLNLDLPNTSDQIEKNKWADFIELLCIDSIDKEISLGDVTKMCVQEDPSFLINGDDEYGEKTDKLMLMLFELFKYIFSRSAFLGKYYPFEKVDEDTIKMSPIDNDKVLYIYLLFASNTSYFINLKHRHFFYKTFEHLSLNILKLIYPGFQCEIFGTASKRGGMFYGGKLAEKLERLANALNTSLRQKALDNSRFNYPSGDGGLDLVSFQNLDKDICKTSRIPVCFGQCSCSYEQWSNKQSSILRNFFNNIFEDIVSCHECMFVPFSLRGINGKWIGEEDTRIITIVIDRIRIINILCINKVDTISIIGNDILLKMKEFLGVLDVGLQ
jgi:hypothetical protein